MLHAKFGLKKFLSKENITFLFILAVGLILRLWRINWGLPELYEEATPLTISWKFWNWGKEGFNFNPNFFNYPALTFYIQFIAQVINYALGYLFGIYKTLNEFGSTMTPLVVTARLVDVIFDAGIIVAIYIITKDIADKRTAIIASIITAINPFQIQYAHLIQVYTILTFFSTIAFLYIYRTYSKPNSKWYILAGIFIALAAASKYTGAFLLPFLIIAHLLQANQQTQIKQLLKHRPLIISIFLSIIIFFALNPYILITPKEFQQDFSFEQKHVATGHLGVSESESTFLYYIIKVLPSSFSWVFILIVTGTIIHFIIKRDKKDLLLLIYPILFIIVVGSWEMRAERYILPIFPIISLIGSIGMIRLWDWLKTQSFGNKIIRSIAAATIFAFILIPTSLSNYHYLKSISLPDTRSIAKSWIKENIKQGSVIATGPYGIYFQENEYQIFDIPFLAFQSERAAPFYDTRWYEDLDLLIASSYDYDRYAKEPNKYRDFLPYYDTLRNSWNLIFEAKPSEVQSGPTIWLYTYPDSLKKSKFDIKLFERFNASPESSRISNFLKNLNAVLYKKGKLEKCEQILREILSVEVENLTVRNQLAQVLFEQGKYELALAHLAISIQKYPNQPEVYTLAGSALRKLKKYPQSEAALNKAIEIQKDYEPAYVELLQLFDEQKDKVRLLDILKRYLAILPENSNKSNEIRKQIQELRKQSKY